MGKVIDRHNVLVILYLFFTSLIFLNSVSNTVMSMIDIVEFKFEMDYGEGSILGQVELFLRSGRLYKNFDDVPYILNNYPPLYQWIISLAGVESANILYAGRLVSFISTIVTSIVLAYIVWMVSPKCSNHIYIKVIGSFIATLLFFSMFPVAQWIPYARIDALGLMFSTLGLAIFMRSEGRGYLGIFSIFLFVLALFTRQSLIAAPMATLSILLARDRHLFFKYAVIFCAVSISTLIFVEINSGGLFIRHVFLVNVTEFKLVQVRWFWQRFVEGNGFYCLVAGFGFVILTIKTYSPFLLFASNKLRLSNDGNVSLPKRVWHKLHFLIYIGFSVLVSATVGKTGASINYLLELGLCTAILNGFFIIWTFDKFILRSDMGSARRITTITFAIIILIPIQALFLLPEKISAPSINNTDQKNLFEAIALESGPVLSENMTVLAIAKKNILFQPFEFTRLSYDHIWDESKFIDMLYNHYFSLIVLKTPLDSTHYLRTTFLTPQAREVIKNKYKLTDQIGHYLLYRPNDGS